MENLRRRIVEEEEIAPHDVGAAGGVCEGGIELVAIGCSTGGPPALQHVFQNLPLLPIPIVVAQHMPPAFTRLFAERVNKLTSYTVKEGDDGELLRERHGLRRARRDADGGAPRRRRACSCARSPAKSSDLYAPSVDRLLTSASDACGERLVAIIMTGMGDDGAQAIRRVRERGGRTIAESPQTAIIFGMPNEAIKTGCVDQVLALDDIPRAIERLCAGLDTQSRGGVVCFRRFLLRGGPLGVFLRDERLDASRRAGRGRRRRRRTAIAFAM